MKYEIEFKPQALKDMKTCPSAIAVASSPKRKH
jgi:mRNA-degrading endonuclease RelE of RelBE toxin-antitoxin system